MDEWRVLHCADLHLDTPFQGVKAREEALWERLKEAPFQALRRIVRHAIEQEVHAVLFAGDTFNSDNPELRAYFAFRDALEELRQKDIPVYIVAGNHDPLPAWKKEFSLPENAFLFQGERPERHTLDREGFPGLELVGVSFPRSVVKEDLARTFPEADPERFSIALMHGTFGEAGSHHPYNAFRTEDVADKGFAIWALGHIHERGIPYKGPPVIHYPGNPQGRHPNEDGPRGCSLLRFQKGMAPELEFLPTHMVRYQNLALDLTGTEDLESLESALEQLVREDHGYDQEDGRILRIGLKGRTPLHQSLQDPARIEELRQRFSLLPSGKGPFRWVDRLEDRTWPDRNPEELRDRGDLVGELWREFEALKEDPAALDEMLEELLKSYGGNYLPKRWKELSSEEKEKVLDRARWALMDEFLKEDPEA